MEHANWLLLLLLLILDAKPSKMEPVSSALDTGSSTVLVFVFLFLIFVKNMTPPAGSVPHVSMDLSSTTELVSWEPTTVKVLFSLLMPDAESGTGPTNNV